MNEQAVKRLDRLMNDRRLGLDLDWKDVADRARIAVQTLDAVRKGKNQPTERTQRRIERALQWGHGSIEAVLAGGEPTPIEQPPTDREQSVPPTTAELEERVSSLEQELADLKAEVRRIG